MPFQHFVLHHVVAAVPFRPKGQKEYVSLPGNASTETEKKGGLLRDGFQWKDIWNGGGNETLAAVIERH